MAAMGMTPGPGLTFRESLVAKAWYALYSGSLVFYLPYVPLFMKRDLGWEPWRIGLIQGLRPWVSAPSCLLLCGIADRTRAHRPLMLAFYAAAAALRGSLAVAPHTFGAVAALVLLGDALNAPCPVIADSTVVSRCRRDGDYGKQRVFASIGWGCLSVVGGALVSRAGVQWGILVYALLCIPGLLAAWALNPGAARAGPAAGVRGESKDGGAGAAAHVGGDKAVMAAAAHGSAMLEPELIRAFTVKDAAVEAAAALVTAGSAPAEGPQSGALAGPWDLRTRLLASFVHDSGSPDAFPATAAPAAASVASALSTASSFRIAAFRSGTSGGTCGGGGGGGCGAAAFAGAELAEGCACCCSCSSTPRSAAGIGERPSGGASRTAFAMALSPFAPFVTEQQQRQAGELLLVVCRDSAGELPAAPPEPQGSGAAAFAAPPLGGDPPLSWHHSVSLGPLPLTDSIEAAAAAASAAAAAAAAAATAGHACSEIVACLSVNPSAGTDAALGGGHCHGGCPTSAGAPPAAAAVAVAAARAALERDLRCFDSATSQAAAAADAFASAKGSLKEAPSVGLAPSPSVTAAARPPGTVGTAPSAAYPAAPPSAPAGLGPLLRQSHVATFLLRALLVGYGNGTQQSFTFLLVQQMGGTGLLMGLMLLCSVLTEVPAFQFQSVLLARFPLATVMSASTALMAVRLGAYSLLPMAPTPWLVLPIELLHGLTFATAWGTGIVTCKRLAPAGLNTSMQSVFSAVILGFGPGLGGIIGGQIMQIWGAQAMFATTSAVILGGWLAALACDAAATIRGRRAAATVAAATWGGAASMPGAAVPRVVEW